MVLGGGGLGGDSTGCALWVDADEEGGGEKGQDWALDPQATVAEAAREKESREALGNLPLPDGSVRLTVSAAQAAAPQADKLLEQARDLQNRGQLDLAEKLLEQARVQSPKNMRVRVAAALLAEARGDSAAAWQRWRELIQESEPCGSGAQIGLGEVEDFGGEGEVGAGSEAEGGEFGETSQKVGLGKCGGEGGGGFAAGGLDGASDSRWRKIGIE